MELIRNIAIIAHIDHGKSTLADRILEQTGALEQRQMREQVLDQMDLERERGITIKMQPVSIPYTRSDGTYTLNIIDTPGHIDFSYEVSRALRAVEAVLLLVDATQGVQAQTLSVLTIAKDLNLTIIPVLTKIDMAHAQIDAVANEVADLLHCSPDLIIRVSGKTGEGVSGLLDAIVDRCPPPTVDLEGTRALVFDFSYTNHTGINAFVRVFGGSFSSGERLTLCGTSAHFSLKDVGVFRPGMTSTESLEAGMIGYFTTGIKEPGTAVVGDTVIHARDTVEPFPGYHEVSPVLWASLYPQQADEYPTLVRALQQVRLSDASLTYEEERSSVLGKGFRCGFLGMLHLETVTERIRREGGLDLVVTTPGTEYVVVKKAGEAVTVVTPEQFPDTHEIASVTEPWVSAEIFTPTEFVAPISQLFVDFEGYVQEVKNLRNNRCSVTGELPLREMMRSFFDRLKSVSSGYASLSYRVTENRPASVVRMDVLLAEEVFPAFSTIISRARVDREARDLVAVLHDTIPRTLFVIKIQARVDGKIIASKTLPALRKDVTAGLYGGDITRKMKLREKQKKGKQKMQTASRVQVSHDTFLKVVQRRSA
ncbi:MAG: translation elongation factor 4 [Candidatus Kaiserbacteria bacterium]|nr:translation elongation factor 4 [Candidatus Kaiserbacteria bacterium]